MSAALKTRPPEPAPAPMLPARLEATAQILDFEPGLYSVEILSPETTRAREGLVLPCLKLDPITPFLPGAGRAFVAALSEGGVLAPGAHPTYVRAEGGKASVLLTIYKVAGARVAPELRVRMISKIAEEKPSQTVPELPSLPLTLLGHIERSGDVTTGGGRWIGQPGGGAIEGFAITPDGDVGPADLEYQAVLGTDWHTPWVRGGEFCGSRGLALPLLGIRIRLVGDAAEQFSCCYSGWFGPRGEIGPVADGALCSGVDVPMEALRVTIVAIDSVATKDRLPARPAARIVAVDPGQRLVKQTAPAPERGLRPGRLPILRTPKHSKSARPKP